MDLLSLCTGIGHIHFILFGLLGLVGVCGATPYRRGFVISLVVQVLGCLMSVC